MSLFPFMFRKWNKKIKGSLCNRKNGELSGIYKHRLLFLPVSGSLTKKRTLLPTNASLGNYSNNAVTNIKVRNYEVLTNFDCLVWETWHPAFFVVVVVGFLFFIFFLKAFFEDNVFSKYFSHWSHLQLQLLGFLAGVLGWVAGKWEQCSLLWTFWFMWSALYHVEFSGHLPRMVLLPSNMNLSFTSLTFFPLLFHTFWLL